MSTTTGFNWEASFKEDLSLYLEQIKESGITESLQGDLEKIIDRWRDTEIHIGLVGDSGVGKSSFVNAICGRKDNDKDAAPTGVTETTRERTKYVHPDNPKIVFWDLPGSDGRSDQKLESYFKEAMLDKYHICFIFHSKRFRENEILLAERVKSLGKPFLIIRAQFDFDIENEKRRLKEEYDEKVLMKFIRDDMKKHETRLGEKETYIYLISNRYPKKWDFPVLTQVIKDNLPKLQRECLTLFIGNISTVALKDKVAILRGRVRVVAIISALRGQKIPGSPIKAKTSIISKEIDFYKFCLGSRCPQFEKLEEMSLENQTAVESSQESSIISALEGILHEVSEENIDSSWSLGNVEIDRSSLAISQYLSNSLDKLQKDAEDRLQKMARKARESHDIT